MKPKHKTPDTKVLDGVDLENLDLTSKNRLGFGYYGNIYSLRINQVIEVVNM